MQTAAGGDDHRFHIGPFERPQDEERVRAWLERVLPGGRGGGGGAGQIECSSSKRVANALLPSIDQQVIRQQIWRNTSTQPVANIPTLGALIRTRQQLAATLGYDSWAHKALANSLASSPVNVWSYLELTAEATREQAGREMDVLAALHRRLGGGDALASVAPFAPFSHSPSAPPTASHLRLQPWDLAYLTEAHKAHSLLPSSSSTSGTHANPQTELSRYFSVDAALEALADLSWELFRIRLSRQPVGPHESWACAAGKSSPDTAGTSKLVVEDADGAPVGVVYIDLFHRPHKFPGAAHFTIQCGFKAGRAPTPNPNPTPTFTHNHNPTPAPTPDAHQLPVVALVFNFAPPAAASPACLSLHDLETLFHEWGHTLHSLLSRTTYQHLSGTRGALDFVEVPSHLLEHFARCPLLLQRWGRHVHSGKSPPLGLIQDALASKVGMVAYMFVYTIRIHCNFLAKALLMFPNPYPD